MKNVQIIDGADNCTYEIYAVTDEDFDAIFPDGADIQFVEDFVARVGEARATDISDAMWRRRIDKKQAQGIHGTIFYDLKRKAVYYPTKKEAEAIPLPR